MIRRFLRWCARQDTVWRVLDATVLRFARYLKWARAEVERVRRVEPLLGRIFGPSEVVTVLGGPFAGMRYPRRESAGSVLAPKLLGTYESELHPHIERLCAKPFARVIDVGCAEGYYAVGLAQRLPSAVVHAFDTDALARRLCREMAKVNGVAHRVIVGKACDTQALVDLATADRVLVVSDCEGCELELFTPPVIRALAPHHLLIECHDFQRPGATAELQRRFGASHSIDIVMSTPDEQRSSVIRPPSLEAFCEAERLLLLAEGRPGVMTWLSLTPRRAVPA